MARQHDPADLQKISLRVGKADIETLRLTYPTVGYNKVIRALISKHCRFIRDKTPTAVIPEIDLNPEDFDTAEAE